MITKDYFEKQLKKHDRITVYAQDNTPLTIFKEPYLFREGNPALTFEMDCADLELYCKHLGLQLKPVTMK